MNYTMLFNPSWPFPHLRINWKDQHDSPYWKRQTTVQLIHELMHICQFHILFRGNLEKWSEYAGPPDFREEPFPSKVQYVLWWLLIPQWREARSLPQFVEETWQSDLEQRTKKQTDDGFWTDPALTYDGYTRLELTQKQKVLAVAGTVVACGLIAGLVLRRKK